MSPTILTRLCKPWYVWRPWQLVHRLRDATYAPGDGYTEITAAWGVPILADPCKTIGRSIRTAGIYDLAVTEVLARLVRRGDTVVDAGANVGYMTMLAAIAAGSSGNVIAWEPHPDLFAVLQRNVSSLRRSFHSARVVARNAALGETAGQADLIVPPGMDANDGLAYLGRQRDGDRAIRVDVERLDEICEGQSISVMKLDVEGAELRVLCGASSLLEAGRVRHIVVEDHSGERGDVIPFLTALGYEVFSLGWSMSGPRLGAPEAGSLATPYEAPSYLATRVPAEALRLCRGGGWRTLRRRFSSPSMIRPDAERDLECA